MTARTPIDRQRGPVQNDGNEVTLHSEYPDPAGVEISEDTHTLDTLCRLVCVAAEAADNQTGDAGDNE